MSPRDGLDLWSRHHRPRVSVTKPRVPGRDLLVCPDHLVPLDPERRCDRCGLLYRQRQPAGEDAP